MRRVLLGIAASAVTLVLAGAAVAQQSATIVLRSGERVSGELVDMGGADFTVRVSGAERRIPRGDVAVIDFAGGGRDFPRAELDQVSGGSQLIVLSNGQAIQGQLNDVGGTRPLKLTIGTGSGTRELNADEVRRIYLSRPNDAGAGSPSTPGAPQAPSADGTVRVNANQAWTDTGITVRKGDRVSFSSSGQVTLSSNAGDTATPDGSASGRRPSGPLPNVLAGALIGRVGPVQIFAIGSQTAPLSMPADGRLFLGVNDDAVGDNSGSFEVRVSGGGASSSSPRRRP